MIFVYSRWVLIGLAIVISLILTACNSEPKEKKSGQAIASVNGKEITMLQLNDELRRANIRADQYETANKQLLESLIARQLIVDEAIRNKLDRTPEVMQARERATAQIIAQSYVQGILAKIPKPSAAEIEEYYRLHPEIFQQRKQFDLSVVRLAASDFTEEVKKISDAAKSLDEVVAWLDKQKIPYNRSLSSRSTTDLPMEIAKAFQEKEKGTIFIVNEQGNSLLMSVINTSNAPISLVAATPQIERFLLNKKQKEASEAEIARLRAASKIEYLGSISAENKPNKAMTKIEDSTISDSETKDGLNLAEPNLEGGIERGIMGLK